jgi:hypothetical protein
MALVQRWIDTDTYYRDHTELSPRERALLHLGMRCITRPASVEKRLYELVAREMNVVR